MVIRRKPMPFHLSRCSRNQKEKYVIVHYLLKHPLETDLFHGIKEYGINE